MEADQVLLIGLVLMLADPGIAASGGRAPTRAVYEHSAESSWAAKKVHSSRAIDVPRRELWTLEGKGEMTFAAERGASALRVDVALAGGIGLPNATARRSIPNEDWREYNRLAFWIRTDVSGFPTLTLMVTIANASTASVEEVHRREATHNVTVQPGKWTLVHWEIPHILRDRVTSIAFRPWVNKLLSDPWDRAAYEIRSVELQRVEADHYEGWNVAPGKIAFSHTGYLPSTKKIALAGGLGSAEFEVASATTGQAVLKKKVATVKTRLGDFRVLDFSEIQSPGEYVLRSGGARTRPFRIGRNTWDSTIFKTLEFFYGERCGMRIPGIHDECHRDWRAVLGDKSVVMNGGWHDAGDLSQGLVNTGEATHAMFALAEELRARKHDPELLVRLSEEAKWGLDWIHKVRFPGGFRIGFASLNIWTNGIIGDQDDRTRAALNNPNVNYIAAAAGAAAYNYLKDSEPPLAKKSLAIAEEDWRHAITGIESPETQSTPAFAATEMELASVGIIASLELYKATGKEEYARKAQELSAIVVASQQREYVGREFPLAGFFYTGPDRQTIFHQFHRASDQAPVLAMSMLCRSFPNHSDWMTWYSTVALHAEYQKRAASTTEPYRVLPAYVYRDDEWQKIAEGDRYGSSRESYRRQVLEGLPMGGGYYLRAFPVWFTRRGNYGILLSQAKALSTAARLRNDDDAMQLAERQLQWVIGFNPFAQSTMWGEGYDFAPQYSVSVGDLVGELPVGMMTHGDRDVPYWPATNSYVYKEVWIHPSVRWFGVVQDVTSEKRKRALDYSVTTDSAADDSTIISVSARGNGSHTFTLRAMNLQIEDKHIKLALKPGAPRTFTWKGRVQQREMPWVAAIIPDGDISNIRDVAGYVPTYPR
jgi:hypothetical protein